jgi:hypothetical protein
MMDERNIKKIPGETSIELNGHVHIFKAHDELHEQSKEIYEELSKLSQELYKSGYIPDTKLVFHNLTEKHKAAHLCSHR